MQKSPQTDDGASGGAPAGVQHGGGPGLLRHSCRLPARAAGFCRANSLLERGHGGLQPPARTAPMSPPTRPRRSRSCGRSPCAASSAAGCGSAPPGLFWGRGP
eukprot:8284297-Alexandrium_andersonii.AAC.1